MLGAIRYTVLFLIMGSTALPTGMADPADTVWEERLAPPFAYSSSGCAGPKVGACVATADVTTGRLLVSFALAPRTYPSGCVRDAPLDCPVKLSGCVFHTPPPWCPLHPILYQIEPYQHAVANILEPVERDLNEQIGSGKTAHALVGTDHILPWPTESIVYTLVVDQEGPLNLHRTSRIEVAAQQGDCTATRNWYPDRQVSRTLVLKLTCPGGEALDAAAVDISVAIRAACTGHCNAAQLSLGVQDLTARMTRAA